ncbi:THUMP domain-containing protein 1-like [Pteropus vampyrus]|uniref:THUMP domain-containing protein 1-like n=1 Tax=Pteropus vampyrus TaxID=132908 RepID=A0A6P6C6B9_PTEVA|nr:THUMP domain-containing protein 1-like [Pteropus vampyrus]
MDQEPLQRRVNFPTPNAPSAEAQKLRSLRIVGSLNSENRVDLTNPQYTVVVETLKAVCCPSVVKDYMLFRKYNLQEVLKGAGDPAQRNRKPAAHAGNGKAAHVQPGDTSHPNDTAEGENQQQPVPEDSEELGQGQRKPGSETQVVKEGGAKPELASQVPEGSKSNENDLSEEKKSFGVGDPAGVWKEMLNPGTYFLTAA